MLTALWIVGYVAGMLVTMGIAARQLITLVPECLSDDIDTKHPHRYECRRAHGEDCWGIRPGRHYPDPDDVGFAVLVSAFWPLTLPGMAVLRLSSVEVKPSVAKEIRRLEKEAGL